MTEETKPNEAEKSTALQAGIQTQLEALSDEEKMLFKVYGNENQEVKAGIPEIRTIYDDTKGVKGNFMQIITEPDDKGVIQKKFVDIGAEIEVTIMRTRFKFGYFDESQGKNGMETLGTPELDDYKSEVNLWNNVEKRIIFTGQYKSFKNYINENYPDPRLAGKGYEGSTIKHTEILYVEFNGIIHRMYLSKSARDNYWKYKDTIKGVPTFAYVTKLSTVTEKKGSITYYPIEFVTVGENEIRGKLALRKKLDADLVVFDGVRENMKGVIDNNTVQGGDPTEAIKEKYKLELPADFKAPNCPNCQAEMILRDSFKGPFFGCPAFPDCKGVVKLEDVMPKTEALPEIDVDADIKEEEKEAIPVEAQTEVAPPAPQAETAPPAPAQAEVEEAEDEDAKAEKIPF